MMDLIGLMGALGSGKTTVARHFETTRGYRRMRMADVLKDMLRTLGLTADEVDGAHKETPSPLLGGKTPRWAMQTLGTEWGRLIIHMDIWVLAIETRILRVHPETPGIVIDDIRFPNEVAMIDRLGGRLAVVRRHDVEPGPFENLHASETYWRTIASIKSLPEIVNNAGIADLLAAADAALPIANMKHEGAAS
jgi:hypothetical protein